MSASRLCEADLSRAPWRRHDDAPLRVPTGCGGPANDRLPMASHVSRETVGEVPSVAHCHLNDPASAFLRSEPTRLPGAGSACSSRTGHRHPEASRRRFPSSAAQPARRSPPWPLPPWLDRESSSSATSWSRGERRVPLRDHLHRGPQGCHRWLVGRGSRLRPLGEPGRRRGRHDHSDRGIGQQPVEILAVNAVNGEQDEDASPDLRLWLPFITK